MRNSGKRGHPWRSDGVMDNKVLELASTSHLPNVVPSRLPTATAEMIGLDIAWHRQVAISVPLPLRLDRRQVSDNARISRTRTEPPLLLVLRVLCLMGQPVHLFSRQALGGPQERRQFTRALPDDLGEVRRNLSR